MGAELKGYDIIITTNNAKQKRVKGDWRNHGMIMNTLVGTGFSASSAGALLSTSTASCSGAPNTKASEVVRLAV